MRWIVLAVALVGCEEGGIVDDTDLGSEGSDLDDDTGTDAGTEADTEAEVDTEADTDPPPPIPVQGTWTTGGLAVTNDPCGLGNFRDVSEFLPETLVVSAASRTSFDLGETVETSQTCAYAVPGFTCGRSSFTEDTGVGAELIFDQGLTGNVVSETSIQAVLDLSATCSGGGCVLVELGGLTFPCAFEATFDMSNP